MRAVVLFAAALLLSSCAWVRHEIAPVPPAVSPTAKPELARPHRPQVERPVPQVQTTQPAMPPAPPPPDYSARCHAMAGNRADDAKQLGASAADQAKVQNDTYRDCMAQSVK